MPGGDFVRERERERRGGGPGCEMRGKEGAEAEGKAGYGALREGRRAGAASR